LHAFFWAFLGCRSESGYAKLGKFRGGFCGFLGCLSEFGYSKPEKMSGDWVAPKCVKVAKR